METPPLMCITHAHSEHGQLVELGHLDSHGNLVWRLTIGSIMVLCRSGVRFVTLWGDKGFEVYVEGSTPSQEARLRTRADSAFHNLLKLLPEFGYVREKV